MSIFLASEIILKSKKKFENGGFFDFVFNPKIIQV
jgi:hypothetical protein